MRTTLASVVARVAGAVSPPDSAKLEERLRKHRDALVRLEDAEVRDAARLTEASAGVAGELAEGILDGPCAVAVRELRAARKARAGDVSSLRLAIEKLEEERRQALAGEAAEAEEARLRRLAVLHEATSARAIDALGRAFAELGLLHRLETEWAVSYERWRAADGVPIPLAGFGLSRALERAQSRAVELNPSAHFAVGAQEVVLRVPGVSLPPELEPK